MGEQSGFNGTLGNIGLERLPVGLPLFKLDMAVFRTNALQSAIINPAAVWRRTTRVEWQLVTVFFGGLTAAS